MEHGIFSILNMPGKLPIKKAVTNSCNCFFIFVSHDVFQSFVAKHGTKQAVTLLQVVALNEALNVELEATVVR
jgi:hypothetical protein